MGNPLLDILSAGREVSVGRGKVTVVPVALSFLFGKVPSRFPELRAQMVAGNASMASAFMIVPEAIPMVLAAGIGKPGDADTEDIMGRLGAAEQIALLNEVLIETKGENTERPLLKAARAFAVTLGLKPKAIDQFLVALGQIDLVVDTSESSSTPSALPSHT